MGLLKIAALLILVAIAINYVREGLKPKVPKDVKGFCTPPFAKVKEAFRENLESGLERGGAFAVYHQGELVCDLWGGLADEAIEYPWQRDTLGIMYSATKAVCAFCLMVLADRGLLDYEKPVAHYWPEFAQNGKEKITVKMLVSHQAGLAAIDEQYSILLFKTDPEKVGKILAAQEPNWPPFSGQSGYHGLTFGPYVDQLLRRVDKKHRGIDQFFREEIAIPFDIDLFIGLPKEQHYRAARFHDFSELGGTLFGLFDSETRALLWNMMSDPVAARFLLMEDGQKFSKYFISWPEYKEVPQGSMNGYATARGLAKLYSILATGGKLGEKVLLSPKTLDKLTTPIFTGIDKMIVANLTWGYGVNVRSLAPGKPQTIFGHPGYGGQIGLGDVSRGLAWSFLTNHPTLGLGDKSPTYLVLFDALNSCLDGKQ